MTYPRPQGRLYALRSKWLVESLYASFPTTTNEKYKDVNPDEYDVFSGHYGYHTAATLGGDMITVLRSPVDRFLSVYYFWRQLHEVESRG